jgi:NAD(P)H dehydrogenase (quinone)
MPDVTDILIVYYSLKGSTRAMAQHIATGVQAAGSSFILRTVPKVSTVNEKIAPDIPDDGAPYVQPEDLKRCHGLLLGSPTRFGNMAAPMKYFIDGLSQEWLQGTFVGKPAGFFTSASSLHGGHESTLLTMMIPLLHQGAVIAGLPYYLNPALMQTKSGGSPYGATHWSGRDHQHSMTHEEEQLCHALGYRIATLAQQLRVRHDH